MLSCDSHVVRDWQATTEVSDSETWDAAEGRKYGSQTHRFRMERAPKSRVLPNNWQLHKGVCEPRLPKDVTYSTRLDDRRSYLPRIDFT